MFRLLGIVTLLAISGGGALGTTLFFTNSSAGLSNCTDASTNATCDLSSPTSSALFSFGGNGISLTGYADQAAAFNPLNPGGTMADEVWWGPYVLDDMGDPNLTCSGLTAANPCNGVGAYDEMMGEAPVGGNGTGAAMVAIDSLVFTPTSPFAATSTNALNLIVVGYNTVACTSAPCPGVGANPAGGHGGQADADILDFYVKFVGVATPVVYSNVGSLGAITYDSGTHRATINFATFITGGNANLQIESFALRTADGAVQVVGISDSSGATPEPGTFAFGGLALLGMGALGRRYARK